MPFTSLLLGVALQVAPPTLHVGWSDELNRVRWKALQIGNKARVERPTRGEVQLSLPHVAKGWPYEYQWSGVTRDADVDVARYPIIAARVSAVNGYAHLDIEALNATGEVVKGLRSTTTTSPGVVTADLSTMLDPAKYHLRIRMIVGGPNEGCSASYSWVRFLKKDDLDFVNRNPDYQNVVVDRR